MQTATVTLKAGLKDIVMNEAFSCNYVIKPKSVKYTQVRMQIIIPEIWCQMGKLVLQSGDMADRGPDGVRRSGF